MAVSAGIRRRFEGGQTSRDRAEERLSSLGRLGLAGRTGFYLILTALTVTIAMLGGRAGP